MANNIKMEENERGVFALHGLTGGLIAVALLLSILVFLSVNAIAVQQENATNVYEIVNPEELKMISRDNENHLITAE
jgi:esterase/lipase